MVASTSNTSVVFNPQGDLVGTYRKIHLFGFDIGEAATLTAGEDVVVIDTPLGRTALATCYDLRFPELFRAFVDEGQQPSCLLRVGQRSGSTGGSYWRQLAPARTNCGSWDATKPDSMAVTNSAAKA